MTNEMMLSYQTRLVSNEEQQEILQKCANLLNKVERSLFSEVAKGKSSTSCKNVFLKKFEITARQFNACRVSLDGKIAAYKESQKLNIINLENQIETLEKKIKILENKPSKQ